MTFKILIKNILGVSFLQSSLERIINLNTNIKSDEFRDIGRLNEESFIRNRKLTFDDLNWLILNKKGMTNAIELYTYYKVKDMESVSTQAFSKARMIRCQITSKIVKKLPL